MTNTFVYGSGAHSSSWWSAPPQNLDLAFLVFSRCQFVDLGDCWRNVVCSLLGLLGVVPACRRRIASLHPIIGRLDRPSYHSQKGKAACNKHEVDDEPRQKAEDNKLEYARVSMLTDWIRKRVRTASTTNDRAAPALCTLR